MPSLLLISGHICSCFYRLGDDLFSTLMSCSLFLPLQTGSDVYLQLTGSLVYTMHSYIANSCVYLVYCTAVFILPECAVTSLGMRVYLVFCMQ